MKKHHLALYGALFAVVSVASLLVGCGGEETTTDTCGPCEATPPCCSTSGGRQVTGVIVPECCNQCPNDSEFAGRDTVTSGGPYLQCNCTKC
jgi:hypothetical protein